MRESRFRFWGDAVVGGGDTHERTAYNLLLGILLAIILLTNYLSYILLFYGLNYATNS